MKKNSKPLKPISQGLIQPKSELMGAVTVATLSKPKEGMNPLRLHGTSKEELTETVNTVMDHAIIAILLEAAGQFAWLQPELPCVICSQERRDHYLNRPEIRTIPMSHPWRSNEYPRDMNTMKCVEPFLAENDNVNLNPDWIAAPFEVEVWTDPGKCFLDLLPIEIFKIGPAYVCVLSYSFTGLDDAIRAVVLKREAKEKEAA